MSADFYKLLEQELARLDEAGVSKRRETVIEGFEGRFAIIGGEKYLVFNSNDYLGLRLSPVLKKAEHEASRKFGTGPGAVRFISGSLKIHRDLEEVLAKFHGREEALVISSAFAANLAVGSSVVRGPGQDTLVNSPVLFVSDELNHRSIVDGIRLGQVPTEQKAIFKHLDYRDMERLLIENAGKFPRVVVVTDGIFSMLGQYADLKIMRQIVDKAQGKYPLGIMLVVDDAHGVGAYGLTGRGTEEVSGTKADVLVGTLGKGFGADGGYVTGDKIFIDYLRETASTYIYSNSISPGTAGAALAALELLQSDKGKELLAKSRSNIALFKRLVIKAKLRLAADSDHPVQAILVGDTVKNKAMAKALYENKMLVTALSYPVVPRGQDELRVQISAVHTEKDIRGVVKVLKEFF